MVIFARSFQPVVAKISESLIQHPIIIRLWFSSFSKNFIPSIHVPLTSISNHGVGFPFWRFLMIGACLSNTVVEILLKRYVASFTSLQFVTVEKLVFLRSLCKFTGLYQELLREVTYLVLYYLFIYLFPLYL